MKRLFLIIFLVSCLIVACSPQTATIPTLSNTQTSTNTPVPEPPPSESSEPHPWRIMPLGDSLTKGNFPNGHHSYRGYLEVQLRESGYAFDFVGSQWQLAHGGTEYEHEGHGGFTIGPDESTSAGWSANISDNLEKYLRHEPEIILLLIGINDMFPLEQRPIDPAEAGDKLVRLVARIQELAPETHIFVASLVPVNREGSEVWPEYDLVNTMAEEIGTISVDDRVYFVDMNRTLTPIMSSADFTDGLHFSEFGARKVAQVWFDTLVDSGLLEGKLEHGD